MTRRSEQRIPGSNGGIETHIGVTNVNTIEGGKIIRQRHYLDHDEALKALGLAE